MIKSNMAPSLVNKISKRIKRRRYKRSYSQSGEDMILKTLFGSEKVGFYVDVGANDPFIQSNTQYFYENGWCGINIDANEKSIEKLAQIRKRDTNIEALISDKEEELLYYYFENPLYNGCVNDRNIPSKVLFSKKIYSIPLSSILLEQKIEKINFLSIDAEGFDFKVLCSLDLSRFRPQVIVIESFSTDLISDLDSDISTHLSKFDYKYLCRSVTNSFYISEEYNSLRFKH